MPFVHVGNLSQLPAGSVMESMVDGSPYAICHVGGSIRALSGICPHQGGPLGQGQIHQGHLVCPYHMWEFDCVTGEYDYNPSVVVPTYEVRIQGDDILVQVD
jgi:nitrite reductase (NADH) small subunit